MNTDTETITVDGDEVDPTSLTFISMVGPGLVVQHQGWAEEELQGPGGVDPDAMVFGDTQEYAPRNAVEAKELLDHPHRQANHGDQSWFCLSPDESDPDVPESADEIPDGYAKVDGEVIPVEELLGENHANGESGASSESEEATDTADLDPLTAEGDGTISRKQDAVEALVAAGVDFSAGDAPSPSDTKSTIVDYAHEEGYYFPNYE
jgi:hypothetical protein